MLVTVGLAGMAVTAAPAAAEEPAVNITDASGEQITLEEPAEEVATLDYATAQIFWEIGAEDRVTGMPTDEAFAGYMDGFDNRTETLAEDGTTPREEVLVDLDPDVVVAGSVYADPSTIESLRELGLTVYWTGPDESLDAIYENVHALGHLVGEDAAANETVTDMQTQIDEIQTTIEGEEEPDVFFHLHDGGWTAAEGTFTDDLISAAGGNNVISREDFDHQGGFGQVSDEVLAERNIDWIVYTDDSGVPSSPVIEQTTAAEEDQMLEVESNFINQAGPRVVGPITAMAEAFYAEQFEADDPATTPADDPTPGFGLAAGLVGTLVASLLAARRYRG